MSRNSVLSYDTTGAAATTEWDFAYALIDDGTFIRVATIESRFPAVMALKFDDGHRRPVGRV